ncbi:MAG: hypothetical protein A3F33_02665, partial [Candidatus Woykebacteria bacterium RIFCSPHIGHO2_12_FULL_43_10]
VPTYNEKENVTHLIGAILAQDEKIKGHSLHVVIADANSPDGTGDAVRGLQKKISSLHLVEDSRRGIGVGLLTGFDYAFNTLKVDAGVSMDADFSHNPNDIPRLVAEFDKGYHVVIGSRYMKGGSTKNWSMVRRMGSIVINQYIKLVLGMKPEDSTTDFRLYTKDVWRKLDKQSVPWERRSFLATLAILYYMLKVSPNFIEIPVAFPDRERGYSKAMLLAYAIDIFKFGLKERRGTIMTFFRFLAVGLTGVVVNLGAISFFIEVMSLNKLLSSALAAETSIFSNFILNNLYTFHGRSRERNILVKFVKYNIVALSGIFITLGVFWFFTHVVYLHYLIAQLLGIGVATPLTFLASIKWAWKKDGNLTKGGTS